MHAELKKKPCTQNLHYLAEWNMQIAYMDIILNSQHIKKTTRSNFVPSSHEGVTAREQKLQAPLLAKLVEKVKHTLILSLTRAGTSPSHTSPACIHTVHYREAKFSQCVKVFSVSDALWSGSERGSAGAVWTLWLKEKLSAHRLWARKCQGTKDDENIWRTQETSWQEWQERLVLTWGSRCQTDDWQPTGVHFSCLTQDSNLC